MARITLSGRHYAWQPSRRSANSLARTRLRLFDPVLDLHRFDFITFFSGATLSNSRPLLIHRCARQISASVRVPGVASVGGGHDRIGPLRAGSIARRAVLKQSEPASGARRTRRKPRNPARPIPKVDEGQTEALQTGRNRYREARPKLCDLRSGRDRK